MNKITFAVIISILFIVSTLCGCNEEEPEIENERPIAACSASPSNGVTPLTVSFVGNGIDSDGEIISYFWNFGDGGQSTNQNPMHTFQKSGSYTVTLTVKDDKGDIGIDTIVVVVNDDVTQPERLIILNPTDDTRIRMKDPDINYGKSEIIDLRNRYGASAHPDYWQHDILIKFDLSSISSNTNIVFANLFLYYYNYDDNDPSGQVIKSYRITQNWNEETATWNNQPTISSTETSQLNMPNLPGSWLSWDVTSDVNNFISGTQSNYGWMLKDTTSWNDYNIPNSKFWSKEHGDLIPYLEIGIDI